MTCPPAPQKTNPTFSRAGLVKRAPGAPMKKKLAARKVVEKPPTPVFEPDFVKANRKRDMAPTGVCPPAPKVTSKVAERLHTLDPKRVRAITEFKVARYKSMHPDDLRRRVLLAGKPLASYNSPNAVYFK